LAQTLRMPHDVDGRNRVMQMAIARTDHVFVLSPEAIAAIDPIYTPDMVDRVRTLMSAHDDAELRDIDVVRRLWAEAVREDGHGSLKDYQGAIAHVLLERGIPCHRGDRSGALFITARDR
jgi:hypothetical protein